MPEATPFKRAFKAVGVERHSQHTILLPENMSYIEGAHWLKDLAVEEREPYNIHEQMFVHPMDGAYALARTLSRRYGAARTVSVPPSMFSGERPPVFIDVALDASGRSVKVPWGRMVLPGTDDPGQFFLETGVKYVHGQPVFVVQGTQRKAMQNEVNEILSEVRTLLAEESIYRGRAVSVSSATLRVPKDQQDYDPTRGGPRFLPVEGITFDDVVLNDETRMQVESLVIAPIRWGAAAQQLGVTQQRGALLYGGFGVGKSLLARVIANEAVRAGMTFVYCLDTEVLTEAYKFAQQYGPSVLFCEDVDRITSGERDHDMDTLLNLMDGIETKGGYAPVNVVFTSNNYGHIHRAFKRPGRIDASIHIDPPNAKSAIQLVQMYARNSETKVPLLAKGAELDRIGEELEGSIPAIIAETVRRASLVALTRNGGDPKNLVIGAEDIVTASRSLDATRRALDEGGEPTATVLEHIGRQAVQSMGAALETGKVQYRSAERATIN